MMGVGLGSLWIDLGSFWDCLGSFWNGLGIALGRFLYRVGGVLVPLWDKVGFFVTVWRWFWYRFATVLIPFWNRFGINFGSSWNRVGHVLLCLVAFWGEGEGGSLLSTDAGP